MSGNNYKIIIKNLIDNLLLKKLPFYSLFNTYKQSKAEINLKNFKKDINSKIQNLEEQMLYKDDNEIKEAFNYIVYEKIINVNIEKKIYLYSNGFVNYIKSDCSFEDFDQYNKYVDDLMLSDIEALYNLYKNSDYALETDVKERLLSRGLIDNNISEELDEWLEDLLGTVKSNLENSYKSGWETMYRKPISIDYKVSKWGEKFLTFFGFINFDLYKLKEED